VSAAARPVLVSSCLCMRMPFEHLLPLAREGGWDLEAVTRETGCGGQCGLCLPYLRRMLRTGETAFHDLLDPGDG
jgi:bacterioferritin-associated ferredoxin